MKVIKIGAAWCPGCIIMKPRWQEIEKNRPWLETEYIDFDDDAEKAEQLMSEKESLPTFIFFDKEDNELIRLHGEISKKELIEKIEQFKNK